MLKRLGLCILVILSNEPGICPCIGKLDEHHLLMKARLACLNMASMLAPYKGACHEVSPGSI